MTMPKTVLLTDGDGAFRTLMVTALRELGFASLEAANAQETDEILSRNHVDLVAIEGDLPGTSGLDWIQARRAGGDDRAIVFLSADWRDVSLNVLTKELGVTGMIYKPISPEEFGERIQNMLRPNQKHNIPAYGELEKRLGRLRSDYAAKLPEKLAHLSACIERATNEDQHAHREALSLAHRLKGTAGSYGLTGVSQACGRIEDLLNEFAGPADNLRAQLQQEIALGLADAERRKAGQDSEPPRSDSSAADYQALVLVVDDDFDMLRQIIPLARRHLIEVVPATTRTEALEKARTQRFDAAVLNVHFCGIPSYQLAADLRELPGYAELPLAFVSADSDLGSRVRAAHSGGAMFIDKPLEGQQFISALQSIIRANEATQPRILIVEDDPIFARSCGLILRNEGIVTHAVSSPSDVIEALSSFRPDLMLLDVDMCEMSGLDVCRAIRLSPEWQTLPIVFLAARTDLESRLATFRAGGDDHLAKPVLAEELVARVTVRLDRQRLIKDRSEKDPLSGLLLRRAFLEQLSQRMSEVRRRGGRLSLALLDLDRFKSINDTRGHLVGDRVINQLGVLLRRRLRTYDVRGRWGGEEFVLALPGEDSGTAQAVVRELLHEFSSHVFEDEQGQAFSVSFTAGVACFPDDGNSIQTLMTAADRRLYVGKSQGRCRVVASD